MDNNSETETIKDISGWSKNQRYGHLQRKLKVSEAQTQEIEGESVLYREVEDDDQSVPYQNYAAVYGVADGDAYPQNEQISWDYRPIEDPDLKKKVEREFEELFKDGASWQD